MPSIKKRVTGFIRQISGPSQVGETWYGTAGSNYGNKIYAGNWEKNYFVLLFCTF